MLESVSVSDRGPPPFSDRPDRERLGRVERFERVERRMSTERRE
jgi:hypothetical protein